MLFVSYAFAGHHIGSDDAYINLYRLLLLILGIAVLKRCHGIFLLEKSVEMLKSKELLPLTGYVHGGCSPIGMKKFFTTVIDISAQNFETIIFSAGKIGYQVELSLDDLCKVIKFELKEVSCQA